MASDQDTRVFCSFFVDTPLCLRWQFRSVCGPHTRMRCKMWFSTEWKCESSCVERPSARTLAETRPFQFNGFFPLQIRTTKENEIEIEFLTFSCRCKRAIKPISDEDITHIFQEDCHTASPSGNIQIIPFLWLYVYRIFEVWAKERRRTTDNVNCRSPLPLLCSERSVAIINGQRNTIPVPYLAL